MQSKILTKVDIPGFDWESGKVRDWTDIELSQRLIISTDRISAFDVVLPNGITDKGWVLNQLSVFWRNFLKERFPDSRNDLVSSNDESCLAYLGVLIPEQKETLKGRMMLVRMAEVIPVECVVRGYISGSLWEKYSGLQGKYSFSKIPIWDHELPLGLEENSQLPEPIFTPTTKAPSGEHDTPLRFVEMKQHIERWLSEHPEIQKKTSPELLAQTIRSDSLGFYQAAQEHARSRGIIIADTKFEFGIVAGELCLIDEVLTPDSSRFWPLVTYKPGGPQPSYDKQPVRDWLKASGWNKKPPAPELPSKVVRTTTERYKEAYQRLTGKSLD